MAICVVKDAPPSSHTHNPYTWIELKNCMATYKEVASPSICPSPAWRCLAVTLKVRHFIARLLLQPGSNFSSFNPPLHTTRRLIPRVICSWEPAVWSGVLTRGNGLSGLQSWWFDRFTLTQTMKTTFWQTDKNEHLTLVWVKWGRRVIFILFAGLLALFWTCNTLWGKTESYCVVSFFDSTACLVVYIVCSRDNYSCQFLCRGLPAMN